MFKPFCVSLDRESFVGAYDTREQAVAAGFELARSSAGLVDSIYVGKRQPTPAQADGHAESVVDAMRDRMRASNGPDDYLDRVNEHQLADLDASIEHAIVDWLSRHQLTPASRVVSISEHPVPAVAAHARGQRDEVCLIGPDAD
jgi:hypothetical protein